MNGAHTVHNNVYLPVKIKNGYRILSLPVVAKCLEESLTPTFIARYLH